MSFQWWMRCPSWGEGKRIERMKKISTRDWIDVGLARFRSCKSNWISNAFLLITHNNLNMQLTVSLFQTSLHCVCDKSCKYRKLSRYFSQILKLFTLISFWHPFFFVTNNTIFWNMSFLFTHIKSKGSNCRFGPDWFSFCVLQKKEN